MRAEDIEPFPPTDPAPDVPEAARNAFLDLMLAHWPRIAATAWDGFRRAGRGAVVVADGSVPPRLTYRPGAPCPCHAEAVSAYAPEREVVLAVVDADADVRWIEILSGWPPPPVAAATVGAAARGEVLH
jgi:hypothetical protein